MDTIIYEAFADELDKIAATQTVRVGGKQARAARGVEKIEPSGFDKWRAKAGKGGRSVGSPKGKGPGISAAFGRGFKQLPYMSAPRMTPAGTAPAMGVLAGGPTMTKRLRGHTPPPKVQQMRMKHMLRKGKSA